MKLKILEGCTDTRMTFDGVDMEQLSQEDLRKNVHQLIDSLNEDHLREFIMEGCMMAPFMEAHFIEVCEQCGTPIYDYTYDY